MKKIIAVVVLLFTTLCYAEEEQRYNFWLSQASMVCGTPSEVQKYVENNEFTPINLSFGRESSNPNGAIVFMVTYYINEYKQTLATIDTQPFGPITSFTKNAVSDIIGPQPASYQPTEPSSNLICSCP